MRLQCYVPEEATSLRRVFKVHHACAPTRVWTLLMDGDAPRRRNARTFKSLTWKLDCSTRIAAGLLFTTDIHARRAIAALSIGTARSYGISCSRIERGSMTGETGFQRFKKKGKNAFHRHRSSGARFLSLALVSINFIDRAPRETAKTKRETHRVWDDRVYARYSACLSSCVLLLDFSRGFHPPRANPISLFCDVGRDFAWNPFGIVSDSESGSFASTFISFATNNV